MEYTVAEVLMKVATNFFLFPEFSSTRRAFIHSTSPLKLEKKPKDSTGKLDFKYLTLLN